MDTSVFMAEYLHCSPETITALLIGCTPIQNSKLKKKRFSSLLFQLVILLPEVGEGKEGEDFL